MFNIRLYGNAICSIYVCMADLYVKIKPKMSAWQCYIFIICMLGNIDCSKYVCMSMQEQEQEQEQDSCVAVEVA